LDWLKFNPDDFRKVDVILGSDIVYERTILPALCDVIKTVLVGLDDLTIEILERSS
jgi:predicted nicotinamide N-methyase